MAVRILRIGQQISPPPFLGLATALDVIADSMEISSIKYNGDQEHWSLWSPGGGMRKIITLIRAHGLLNRAHGLLNRAHGLLSRAHGLARLNNYFPHVTSGAP